MASRYIPFWISFGLVLRTAVGAEPLQIVVVEGEGAINNIQMRRAKAPVVKVETEGGAPVSGAVVYFLAPTRGPGGIFGEATEATALTDAEGRATALGFRPNKTAGQFEIRVTASYQGQAANARITQTNAEPAVVTHSSSKKIAILAILGGAVAGGAALAARGGSGGKSAPVAAATPGTVITLGNPSFTAP